MAERGAFQYAASSYPLATGTGNSALRDADPATYWAASFFAFVLQQYMGSRIAAEAAAINLSTGPNAITQAVQYFLPYDPITYLQEQQVGKWPLLAIWRTTGKDKWKVIGRMDRASTWKIAWVLPPIAGFQREHLQPFVNKSVHDIILDRIENMGDPAWNAGASPWDVGYANLEEINLVSDVTGAYEIPQTNMVFPAWIGELQVIERQENLPHTATGGQLTGIDIEIDLVPPGPLAPLNNFVNAQVNYTVFTGQLGTLNSRPSWLEPGVM